MKKFLHLSLLLITLFIFAACETTTTPTPSEPTVPTEPSEPSEPTPENPKSNPQPDTSASFTTIDQVPNDIVRRALWQLDEARDTELAPGWETAELSSSVALFYRPDLTEVAYYEFAVTGSKEGGFILISAGTHDYPIAHWDFQGKALSLELQEQSAENGSVAFKFYKLDSLSYAAEDKDGNQSAQLGNALLNITGVDPNVLDDKEPDLGRAYTVRKDKTADTENEDFEFELVTEGKQESDLKFIMWNSWAELKENYAKTYEVFIKALELEAAEAWELVKEEAEFGEGLFEGEVRNISTLKTTGDIQLTGAGAKFVKITPNPDLSNNFLLEVSGVTERLPFIMNIVYEDGSSETIPYFLMPNAAPAEDFKTQSSWSAWSIYYADGGHSNQPRYTQFLYSTPSPGCYSGCGPTAWGMLFAWGDYQAENGNSYWQTRCGLYGGCGTAPSLSSFMSIGVRDMIDEIRTDVDTFCISSPFTSGNHSGATFPWDMPQASQYFIGRTGTDLDAHWNSAGISEPRLRNYARSSIIFRDTPAVIGTGWLTHYPMAYGYASRSKSNWLSGTTYDRLFYVNQGWGGSSNGWINASTWFAGEIIP